MPENQEPISNVEPSIAELAAFAFNEQMLTPPTEAVTAPSNQPTNESVPASVENQPPANTQPNEEIVDDVVYLQQQLGVNSWDEVKAMLNEYNQLKTNPPKSEPVYANEESKKWAQYLAEGKEDDLYNSLHGRKQVRNLETMTDDQKLKLYIKMQNPRFDDELVHDEYNSLYSLDENDEKFLDATGNVDQLKLRKEKVRMQQRIENDVQKAQEYFSQYKSKIELPDIQKQQTVDEAYEEYKASNAKSIEDYNTIVAPAIKSLKESDVNLGFNVNDENNQMQFDIALTPDPQDFEKAKQDALSVLDFLTKTCYDESGKFKPNELAELILLKQNFKKYGYAIAKQAVNAERKRVIDKETGGNSLSRDYSIAPEVKTELQKRADMAFSV